MPHKMGVRNIDLTGPYSTDCVDAKVSPYESWPLEWDLLKLDVIPHTPLTFHRAETDFPSLFHTFHPTRVYGWKEMRDCPRKRCYCHRSQLYSRLPHRSYGFILTFKTDRSLIHSKLASLGTMIMPPLMELNTTENQEQSRDQTSIRDL